MAVEKMENSTVGKVEHNGDNMGINRRESEDKIRSERNEATTLLRETVNVGRSLVKVILESIAVPQGSQMGLGTIRAQRNQVISLETCE